MVWLFLLFVVISLIYLLYFSALYWLTGGVYIAWIWCVLLLVLWYGSVGWICGLSDSSGIVGCCWAVCFAVKVLCLVCFGF